MNKDLVFLEIAETLAHLGTCNRAKVGCVITRDGRAISWGYNGAPPGMPHCDQNNHGHDGWDSPVDQLDSSLETMPAPEVIKQVIRDYYNPVIKELLTGCRNATHAEANALAFAARQGISTDGATLYVTLSPCAVCARLIIAAGIECVVTNNLYRDSTGWDMLPGRRYLERD